MLRVVAGEVRTVEMTGEGNWEGWVLGRELLRLRNPTQGSEVEGKQALALKKRGWGESSSVCWVNPAAASCIRICVGMGPGSPGWVLLPGCVCQPLCL